MKRACRICGAKSERPFCPAHRSRQARGYGRRHELARAALAATLPALCGYCGVVIQPSERWVAAHRIDGRPEYGYIPAHATCNERAKAGG